MGYAKRAKSLPRRSPSHDGHNLAPCSPSCKACKAEREEIARLGPAPLPDRSSLRGAARD